MIVKTQVGNGIAGGFRRSGYVAFLFVVTAFMRLPRKTPDESGYYEQELAL